MKPAVSTLKIGPTPLGPALRARIQALLRRPAPELPAFIREQIDRQVACNRRDQDNCQMREQVDNLIDRAKDYGGREKFSQRKLAGKLGISWGTWRRLRQPGQNLAAWLPILRARVVAIEGGRA